MAIAGNVTLSRYATRCCHAGIVARARREGRNVAALIGQRDMFAGATIDPVSEAFLRLMFRNANQWTQPAGRAKVADALAYLQRRGQQDRSGR